MEARDVILLVGGIAAISLAGPLLTLAILKRHLGRRVAAGVDRSSILGEDYQANFFGVESAGVLQMRGNGALVLTDTALEFFMAVPSRRFTIPLEEVTGVELVRSHLGKTVFRDLLKVSFRRGGAHDSMAWWVPDAAAWRDRIVGRTRG